MKNVYQRMQVRVQLFVHGSHRSLKPTVRASMQKIYQSQPIMYCSTAIFISVHPTKPIKKYFLWKNRDMHTDSKPVTFLLPQIFRDIN